MMIVRKHKKWYTWWGPVGVSSRREDWPASLPLHRVDVDCFCSTNLKMQSRAKHEILPHPKHTTKSQKPGDRDHLETACDETRPTRPPILVRFHRARVCGNRPRAALAKSKKHESHTQTDGQTN